MELLLFRPLDFQREYNCSRVNVEDVPLAERQNVWNGIALMFLFFLLERTVSQKHMFFQVAIISGFNCYACLLYVYMQYVDLNKTVVILASYGWFFIHGIPPVIYLTLNASIRRDCAKMVQKLCLSGDAIGIGGSTTAMGSQQQKQGGSGGGTSKCRVQVLGIRQQQQQQQKLGGVGGKPGPKQPQQQSGGSRAQKPSAMRNFLQAHAQGAAIGSATC